MPIILVLLVLLGGLFWFSRGKKAPEAPVEEAPTVLSLGERPYISLTPTREAHHFKLEIENIRQAETIEYELVYFSNDLSRGVIDAVDLEGKDVFTKEILLGSCSKDVCKYDENITSGTLTLRFRGPSGVQKYVVPFNLYEGTGQMQEATLEEGNFSFEGKLRKGRFYLICQTVGLPGKVEGEVIGGSFGIFTEEKTAVSGKIQIGSEEDLAAFKVLAWDPVSSSWGQLSSGLETDGKLVRVETDKLTVFVVTSQ